MMQAIVLHCFMDLIPMVQCGIGFLLQVLQDNFNGENMYSNAANVKGTSYFWVECALLESKHMQPILLAISHFSKYHQIIKKEHDNHFFQNK